MGMKKMPIFIGAKTAVNSKDVTVEDLDQGEKLLNMLNDIFNMIEEVQNKEIRLLCELKSKESFDEIMLEDVQIRANSYGKLVVKFREIMEFIVTTCE